MRKRSTDDTRSARRRKRSSFIFGRLATYRYYNMDQIVGMALAEFDRLRRGLTRPEIALSSSVPK